MEQVNVGSWGPLFALGGVMATVFVNFLIQKTKSKTEHLVSDRSILSKDQENFKNSILAQLHECNELADKLQQDLLDWQRKYLEEQERRLVFTQEIISLKQQVMQLSKRTSES